MSFALEILLLAALIAVSAALTGSENGFYSLSRVQVEIEAREGRRIARIVRHLLRDDVALLITILIGVNLVQQLATYQTADLFDRLGVPEEVEELAVTLCLGPLLFFFGELLPKDLFRRRPRALLGLTAPFILVARYALWPLERLCWLTVALLSRLLGLEPRLLSEVKGREAVLRLLEEGAEKGVLEPHAELLARNVLQLRTTAVDACMVPWERVLTLDAALPEVELHAAVAESPHSRLPVVGEGGRVLGYVHQLDVLGRKGDGTVLGKLHEVVEIEPKLSVDRALARLRWSGQRLAIVGPRAAPLGMLTLKDLLEQISGELATA